MALFNRDVDVLLAKHNPTTPSGAVQLALLWPECAREQWVSDLLPHLPGRCVAAVLLAPCTWAAQQGQGGAGLHVVECVARWPAAVRATYECVSEHVDVLSSVAWKELVEQWHAWRARSAQGTLFDPVWFLFKLSRTPGVCLAVLAQHKAVLANLVRFVGIRLGAQEQHDAFARMVHLAAVADALGLDEPSVGAATPGHADSPQPAGGKTSAAAAAAAAAASSRTTTPARSRFKKRKRTPPATSPVDTSAATTPPRAKRRHVQLPASQSVSSALADAFKVSSQAFSWTDVLARQSVLELVRASVVKERHQPLEGALALFARCSKPTPVALTNLVPAICTPAGLYALYERMGASWTALLHTLAASTDGPTRSVWDALVDSHVKKSADENADHRVLDVLCAYVLHDRGFKSSPGHAVTDLFVRFAPMVAVLVGDGRPVDGTLVHTLRAMLRLALSAVDSLARLLESLAWGLSAVGLNHAEPLKTGRAIMLWLTLHRLRVGLPVIQQLMAALLSVHSPLSPGVHAVLQQCLELAVRDDAAPEFATDLACTSLQLLFRVSAHNDALLRETLTHDAVRLCFEKAIGGASAPLATSFAILVQVPLGAQLLAQACLESLPAVSTPAQQLAQGSGLWRAVIEGGIRPMLQNDDCTVFDQLENSLTVLTRLVHVGDVALDEAARTAFHTEAAKALLKSAGGASLPMPEEQESVKHWASQAMRIVQQLEAKRQGGGELALLLRSHLEITSALTKSDGVLLHLLQHHHLWLLKACRTLLPLVGLSMRVHYNLCWALNTLASLVRDKASEQPQMAKLFSQACSHQTLGVLLAHLHHFSNPLSHIAADPALQMEPDAMRFTLLRTTILCMGAVTRVCGRSAVLHALTSTSARFRGPPALLGALSAGLFSDQVWDKMSGTDDVEACASVLCDLLVRALRQHEFASAFQQHASARTIVGRLLDVLIDELLPDDEDADETQQHLRPLLQNRDMYLSVAGLVQHCATLRGLLPLPGENTRVWILQLAEALGTQRRGPAIQQLVVAAQAMRAVVLRGG